MRLFWNVWFNLSQLISTLLLIKELLTLTGKTALVNQYFTRLFFIVTLKNFTVTTNYLVVIGVSERILLEKVLQFTMKRIKMTAVKNWIVFWLSKSSPWPHQITTFWWSPLPWLRFNNSEKWNGLGQFPAQAWKIWKKTYLK